MPPTERGLEHGDPGPDLLLMQRLAARDAAALGELYDRHSGLLYSLIARILSRREAEDVLQEVFVEVWTRCPTFDAGRGSAVGWLVSIARNRALDRLRAGAAGSRAGESPGIDHAAGASAGAAVVGEEQRAVARALGLLPPEQRTLIEQAYFLGLTQSELSERHHLPLGTVKTRIRTGMQALRHYLSPSFVPQ